MTQRMPAKFSIILLCLLLCLQASAQNNGKLTIQGTVYENMGKTPLQGATVRLLDAKGTVIDSTKTSGRRQTGNTIKNLARFSFSVPRTEGTRYTLEAEATGYDPGYMDVTIHNLGRRETVKEIPTIYLVRARQLEEVTVTASKIKFYHKLDTLVYDASAF